MNKFLFLALILFISLGFNTQGALGQGNSPDYVAKSVELLETVRLNQTVEGILDVLAQADPSELMAQLTNDQQKKVFWINVYNAMVQIKLSQEPELFENKGAFFKLKFFKIAGYDMSLDLVEHGFLRRFKIKASLGYLSKPVFAKYKKAFCVDKVDNRIHFVLNCGAAACPPVQILQLASVEEQMENAARTYIQNTTQWQSEENRVQVTRLMSWFRGDFKGKKGIRKILKSYEIIPESAKPKVDYLDYDWTLKLATFEGGKASVISTDR